MWKWKNTFFMMDKVGSVVILRLLTKHVLSIGCSVLVVRKRKSHVSDA